MAYLRELKIPPQQMKALWSLREYAGRGAIALQIRRAVADYLKDQEKEIGCPLSDLQVAIEEHEQDKCRDEA